MPGVGFVDKTYAKNRLCGPLKLNNRLFLISYPYVFKNMWVPEKGCLICHLKNTISASS